MFSMYIKTADSIWTDMWLKNGKDSYPVHQPLCIMTTILGIVCFQNLTALVVNTHYKRHIRTFGGQLQKDVAKNFRTIDQFVHIPNMIK